MATGSTGRLWRTFLRTAAGEPAGPEAWVPHDGDASFLTWGGGRLLDVWNGHLLSGNTQEYSGVLADTWFPSDGEKKRKVCGVCVCVCVTVHVEDVVRNLGCSETFLDSWELCVLESSHYSLRTHYLLPTIPILFSSK